MCELFRQSIRRYGVRYSTYIGDGDSSTFKNILNLNPYGDEFQVQKRECVGHVQKRMGSQLRALKKKEKLGSRGKLTESLITQQKKSVRKSVRKSVCLLYTSPSPRDRTRSRMPSSA